jgi:rhodanese-related sulfurtransferase
MKYIFILFAAIIAVVSAGCRSAPTITTDSPPVARTGVIEMSPAEARPGIEAAYSQFVDVRTPAEFAGGHAYRAINIPLDTLPTSLDKLEKNEPIYVICQTGVRSKKAADLLVQAGFKQAISVAGGTTRWQAEGLPMSQD